MHVHDLRCFLALADGLDPSCPSRRPVRPAPDLLAATARLETDVGQALLEGRPGGYRLTPAGELMVSHPQGLLAAADEMLLAVRTVLADRSRHAAPAALDEATAAG